MELLDLPVEIRIMILRYHTDSLLDLNKNHRSVHARSLGSFLYSPVFRSCSIFRKEARYAIFHGLEVVAFGAYDLLRLEFKLRPKICAQLGTIRLSECLHTAWSDLTWSLEPFINANLVIEKRIDTPGMCDSSLCNYAPAIINPRTRKVMKPARRCILWDSTGLHSEKTLLENIRGTNIKKVTWTLNLLWEFDFMVVQAYSVSRRSNDDCWIFDRGALDNIAQSIAPITHCDDAFEVPDEEFNAIVSKLLMLPGTEAGH